MHHQIIKVSIYQVNKNKYAKVSNSSLWQRRLKTLRLWIKNWEQLDKRRDVGFPQINLRIVLSIPESRVRAVKKSQIPVRQFHRGVSPWAGCSSFCIATLWTGRCLSAALLCVVWGMELASVQFLFHPRERERKGGREPHPRFLLLTIIDWSLSVTQAFDLIVLHTCRQQCLCGSALWSWFTAAP